MKSRGLDPDHDQYPLCEVCAVEGLYHNARDVDHIYGRGGKHDKQGRMNDPENLIFVCRQVHNEKGMHDKRERKRIAGERIAQAKKSFISDCTDE